jgi:hypothetical protein
MGRLRLMSRSFLFSMKDFPTTDVDTRSRRFFEIVGSVPRKHPPQGPRQDLKAESLDVVLSLYRVNHSASSPYSYVSWALGPVQRHRHSSFQMYRTFVEAAVATGGRHAV